MQIVACYELERTQSVGLETYSAACDATSAWAHFSFPLAPVAPDLQRSSVVAKKKREETGIPRTHVDWAGLELECD